MSTAQTYQLKYPVELKNTQGEVTDTLKEITLDRLNGKAMREIANARAKGEGDMMAVLVSKSAKLPPSTVDQLDAEDFTEAASIASGFIGGVQPTGAMS